MACRISRLKPQNSVLFVCDLQEKFRHQIKFFPEICIVGRRLIDAAKILDIKTIATEHYPKGLGRFVPELGIRDRPDISVYEKVKVS
ncbi:unnamed protein product, partial [Mesorhabditis belari]|uniref:Isochorismatase-like domain-containing protein n=1 Tax=Mesorhabditis belari TaxID=2138241 RepID=A0AAF3FFE2_9BILA